MKKGQLVKVKAIVESAYYKHRWELYSGEDQEQYRCIYRKRMWFTAIFLGYSHIKEGLRQGSSAEYGDYGALSGPADFILKKQHKVCILEPFITGDNRYYKPIRALPEDVEELGL